MTKNIRAITAAFMAKLISWKKPNGGVSGEHSFQHRRVLSRGIDSFIGAIESS